MSQKNPLLIALSYYGQSACPGFDTNLIIKKFFDESGHSEINDDETPWCSAFLGAVMYEAGLPVTGSLLARSWLDIGVETLEPKLGDIVIFWRKNKKGIYGHVGFYISEDAGMVYCLGGNQKNSVCITPYAKSQILGYRQLEIQA